MRRIFFLCLPLLAGCVSQPSLESRMAAYTGASAQTLVQNLGVPDKQITVSGIDYLAYTRHRTVITPGVGAFGGFGGFGGYYGGGGFFPGAFYGGPFLDPGIPPQVNEYSCETTFLLKDDKVFNFTLRGNDCA